MRCYGDKINDIRIGVKVGVIYVVTYGVKVGVIYVVSYGVINIYISISGIKFGVWVDAKC